MITTGQTLQNPATGETLVFRTTSADTNGELVVEAFVEPDGAVAAAHVHPSQEERFEVLAGELEFRLGKRKLVARAGDRVLVRQGRRTGSATWVARRRTSSAKSAPRSVRAADRDDVLARSRWQGLEEGHAQSAPARRHREAPLRRRPAALPARVAPAAGGSQRAHRSVVCSASVRRTSRRPPRPTPSPKRSGSETGTPRCPSRAAGRMSRARRRLSGEIHLAPTTSGDPVRTDVCGPPEVRV